MNDEIRVLRLGLEEADYERWDILSSYRYNTFCDYAFLSEGALDYFRRESGSVTVFGSAVNSELGSNTVDVGNDAIPNLVGEQ